MDGISGVAEAPMMHSPDDARWIREQLNNLPQRYRQQAMDGYSAAYQEAHEAEPAPHRKENAARFAANTRLRIFVEKTLAR